MRKEEQQEIYEILNKLSWRELMIICHRSQLPYEDSDTKKMLIAHILVQLEQREEALARTRVKPHLAFLDEGYDR